MQIGLGFAVVVANVSDAEADVTLTGGGLASPRNVKVATISAVWRAVARSWTTKARSTMTSTMIHVHTARGGALGAKSGPHSATVSGVASTEAPAPSPKRMAVERSWKSVMVESFSAPTTSAVRLWPEAMSPSATVSA